MAAPSGPSCTVYESLLEPAFAAERSFDALHAPVIVFMIVPQEVQQAVQSQHAPLGALGVARRAGLPLRNTPCDGHFAQLGARGPRIEARKTQHIRRRVHTAETAIELTDLPIADERDRHRAARTRGRDTAEPGRETGGAHAPPASVTDQYAQRRCRW